MTTIQEDLVRRFRLQKIQEEFKAQMTTAAQGLFDAAEKPPDTDDEDKTDGSVTNSELLDQDDSDADVKAKGKRKKPAMKPRKCLNEFEIMITE